MKKKKSKTGFLLNLVLGVLLYAVIHELGHCLAVWYLGGIVTNFSLNIVAPFTSFIGVEDNGLISVSGTMIPLICTAVFLFSYRSKPKNNRIVKILGCFSILSLTALFEWIVIPIARIGKYIPIQEDVSNFIDITGVQESLVIIMAGMTFLVLFAFVIRKKIFDLVITMKKTAGKYFFCGVLVSGIFLGFMYGNSQNQIYDNLKVTVKVKEGIANAESKQIPITIKTDGNYVISGGWTVDNPGILTGFTLLDTQGKVIFNRVGEQVTNMNSNSLSLKKGQYALVLFFISNEESWDKYASVSGVDSSDSNYAFSKKGEWELHITYRIVNH